MFTELRNGWLIKTRSKSFAVFAATGTEKKEWMLHIERCVNDILTKGLGHFSLPFYARDFL